MLENKLNFYMIRFFLVSEGLRGIEYEKLTLNVKVIKFLCSHNELSPSRDLLVGFMLFNYILLIKFLSM